MEEVDELCDLIGFINHGKLMVLEKNTLKAEYGQSSLKVVYRNETNLLKKRLLLHGKIVTP